MKQSDDIGTFLEQADKLTRILWCNGIHTDSDYTDVFGEVECLKTLLRRVCRVLYVPPATEVALDSKPRLTDIFWSDVDPELSVFWRDLASLFVDFMASSMEAKAFEGGKAPDL